VNRRVLPAISRPHSLALEDLIEKIRNDTYAEDLPAPKQTRKDLEMQAELEDYAEALARAKAIIGEAAKQAGRQTIVAISGGTDSLVLIDILHKAMAEGPPAVFCDTGMEYTETKIFVSKIAKQYGVPLYTARPTRSPREQWEKKGWPFLGKLPARKWMQAHKERDYGFRLNVTACCQAMKIAPVRKLMKKHGYQLKFAGVRGAPDDQLRSLRAHKDGSLYKNKESSLWQAHPLLGWTDGQVIKYTKDNKLPRHPLKKRGLLTTGCIYCGGGCQFENSGYRILRHIDQEAWRRFFLEWRAGEILLAIKHDRPLWLVQEAVDELGGLEKLAEDRPFIFDYCRTKPLKGYER